MDSAREFESSGTPAHALTAWSETHDPDPLAGGGVLVADRAPPPPLPLPNTDRGKRVTLRPALVVSSPRSPRPRAEIVVSRVVSGFAVHRPRIDGQLC
jgi:hypothetical protein